jgi:hypothetical protein
VEVEVMLAGMELLEALEEPICQTSIVRRAQTDETICLKTPALAFLIAPLHQSK